MLALAEFTYIVVLKIAFHLDGGHGTHMNQRFQSFSGLMTYLGFTATISMG